MFSLNFALLDGGDGDGKIKSANLTFILQGLGYIALPECHVLPKIYLEDVSWGEVIKDISQCLVCTKTIVIKVMEMINKNVSMDFEALKKHARMNYWQMDEVNLNILKSLISTSSSSCSSASRESQTTPSRVTQWLDPGLVAEISRNDVDQQSRSALRLPLCLHGGQRLRERKHEQE